MATFYGGPQLLEVISITSAGSYTIPAGRFGIVKFSIFGDGTNEQTISLDGEVITASSASNVEYARGEVTLTSGKEVILSTNVTGSGNIAGFASIEVYANPS